MDSMPPKPQQRSAFELFRSHFDQLLNPAHELVQLARKIDWGRFETGFASCYTEDMGAPAKATRLMVGLQYLKYTFNESDDSVVARWVENPYWQYFCGFTHLQHECPIHPSSMSRWRKRVGVERLESLLHETIALAKRDGHVTKSDLARVNVDTTVQEKAITFPTDAKLLDRARVMLVKLANRHGLKLRQGYPKVGKLALIKYQRYAHAKQWNRARRELRRLRTILGRVIRDIDRQVRSSPSLNTIFRPKLFLASRVHAQERGKRGAKVYSIHAPEVECIGKGKAAKPYEFGVKVSVATTIAPSRGGQFVLAAKAMPGAPYDGHTLATVIPHLQDLIGNEIKRIVADKGYRGHGLPAPYDMRVYVSEQKRGVTPAIRRELRRRAAVEPVIGHLKTDHRMDRNFLIGSHGDATNAVLAAVGYNFRRLAAWLKALLWALLLELLMMPKNSVQPQPTP
jgi:IS5 family transposase